MKTKAVGFRVHVKPDVSDTERAANRAGIVLAEAFEKQNRQAVDTGTVLDIGPIAWRDYGGEPWVAVGDKIVYARHAGYAVGEGADKIFVINDEDVVTKVENQDV